jgi:hypothetical protein
LTSTTGDPQELQRMTELGGLWRFTARPMNPTVAKLQLDGPLEVRCSDPTWPQVRHDSA